MINDVLEVDNDGELILSCNYITVDDVTFYSMEVNGVTELNKELFFYE